ETGSAYVTGYAQTGFPITPGVVQSTNNGGYDAFVAKLDPSGSQLVFSTYIGGNGGTDVGSRILLDSDHNIYLGGYGDSPNFPTTTGAYQETYQGGTYDAYITKLNPTASELLFSTYLGGNAIEYLYDITLDADRNVYVTGSTTSSNFPTTPGCYDDTHNGVGTEDGFVTKMNSTGTNLFFSTFIGGSHHDEAIISVVEPNGEIVFSGVSHSWDFPTTETAYDRTYNGGWDIILGKLSADGSLLLYSTFFGGSSTDYGWWMNKDKQGDYIISGRTSSSDFPTTEGAFDQTHNGGPDIVVLKFRFGTSLLKGKVFHDQNANGVFDAQEYTMANFPVKLNPGSVVTTTTNDGEYSFSVTPGTYEISQLADTNWAQTVPLNPSLYTLNLLEGDTVQNLNFGNRATRVKFDLAVDMVPIFPVPLTTPCCGQPMWYMIRYRNLGTVPSRGAKLQLLLASPQLVFQPPVISIPQLPPPIPRGRNLEFTLPSPLLPGKSGTIYVKTFVNCLVTETPTLRASILIQGWDNNFSNNHVMLDNKATCSHDPNDKQVSPVGCGPSGFINRSDTLTYTIRFQNNGTGPARRVILRDTLDADLELSTVEPLLASHAYVFEIIGNELTWTFYPIDLPDSASDELGSQGYVKFRVLPRADVSNGTSIENRAGIYFDLNEPVLTNFTLNTITDEPQPRGDFRIVNERIHVGVAVSFQYTGGTEGAQFVWNFGEGAIPETSHAQNPTGVMYSSVGPAVVSLDVITENCVAPVSYRVIDVLDTSTQVQNVVANERWNLLSLPLIPSNVHVDSVFPGRISDAISFEREAGYQTETFLRNGRGYWLKFSYPAAFPVSGTEVLFDSIEINAGWNLIGSLSDSIPYSSFQTSPENILSSFLYGYERTYRITDTLLPGKGYWIKANDTGTMYLSGLPGSFRKNEHPEPMNILRSYNELIFLDRNGNEQHLYFGKGDDMLARKFVMPPMPPSDAFDVRFKNGFSVANLDNERENTFPIQTTGVSYPLKISWNVHQQEVRARIHVSGKTILLQGKSATTLEDEGELSVEVLNTTSNVIPDEFALHQAFPNPFNPTTLISFDLPFDASITLKVYDVLGREVTVLKENQHHKAGVYEVQFDANYLASGLYLYRITAQNSNGIMFGDVKKMLLVR
ncbi:MAG: SBBP repeat-containing protein, partial [Ignavibacteriae bacterium]|nr:SBBP repeat-containing protein [Ignavibacteriota bacterium]